MTDPRPITGQELEEMKRRCEKATPAPWYHDPDRGWDRGGIYSKDPSSAEESFDLHGHEVLAVQQEFIEGKADDGEFIAHARTDLPRLIAEVERLRTIELASKAMVDGIYYRNCHPGMYPCVIESQLEDLKSALPDV